MLLEMTGWLSWGGNSWLKLTEDNEGGIKAGKLGEEIEGALLEYPKEGGEEKADDCSPLCFYEIKEENFYWPLSVAREDAKTVTDEAAGVHMARAEEFMLRRKFYCVFKPGRPREKLTSKKIHGIEVKLLLQLLLQQPFNKIR